MKTFFYIIQKLLNQTSKIYNYQDENDENEHNFFSFWREIKTNETDIKYNSAKYNMYDLIVKKHILKNKSKFYLLNEYLTNIFSLDFEKESTLLLFCKIQKIYHSLSRLAHIYKFKKYKVRVTTDLLLNDINANSYNVISILQNGHKYLFTISDILTIIKNAICNSQDYFSKPLVCKNPYNGLCFNKSTLYNIYFFIRYKNYIMPDYLQNYFLSNFCLQNFCNENEPIIRKYSILSQHNNMDDDEIYNDITDMIEDFNSRNGRSNKIIIHKDFPKSVLIRIFKPYFLLYLLSNYSSCSVLKRNYSIELHKKLVAFQKSNPTFGRKLRTVSGFPYFNVKNKNFYDNETIEEFMNSHKINSNSNPNFNRNVNTYFNIIYNDDDDSDIDLPNIRIHSEMNRNSVLLYNDLRNRSLSISSDSYNQTVVSSFVYDPPSDPYEFLYILFGELETQENNENV